MSFEVFKEKVFSGPEIELLDMLDARETRMHRQEELFTRYKSSSALISMTLNIPGNVKTSKVLEKVFDEMVKKIKHQLKNEKIIYDETFHLKTGSEAYFLLQMNPLELKEKTVYLEEIDDIGRIFDIDVLVRESGVIRAIKRQEIGREARKCFVCQRPAKECARSRKHSIEEIQKIITHLLQKNLL